VRVKETLEFLRGLGSDADGLVVESGERDDEAWLKLVDPARQGRWAVVSTPGDRWFSVETDTGHSLDRFEEDASPDQVRSTLSHFVEVARTYVESETVPVASGWLGITVLSLATSQGEVSLRRSVSAEVRRLLRRGR